MDKYVPLCPPYFHKCPVKPGCICDSATVNKTNLWDWSFVDTIFCICLKERDDRLASSADQFHRFGLCTRVMYYRPDRPTDQQVRENKVRQRGAFGCWESHRFLAWYARNQNARRSLVFEDDVNFRSHLTPDVLTKVASHLAKLPQSWDIYYLGHQPIYSCQNLGDNLWRVHSARTHALIVSTKMMDHLIHSSFAEIAKQRGMEVEIDRGFVIFTEQYAYSPMLAVQTNSSSDNCVDWYGDWIRIFYNNHPDLHEFLFMRLGPTALLIICLLLVFALFRCL